MDRVQLATRRVRLCISDPMNCILNESLVFGARIGGWIIAALEIYEATLGDLFSPADQSAPWVVAPPVIAEHFFFFDGVRGRIKVRFVKVVVAREKRFNLIFEHLKQIEFIGHREGFRHPLSHRVGL